MNFYFIGVTTRQSAIVRILPLWAEALGIKLDLIGFDLPIDAQPAQYRNAAQAIKNDPKALGAVVTTHKLKLFEHASDIFDDLDPIAQLTKEISSIAKRGSRLVGLSLPDCLSTSICLKVMLGANYWRTHASDVLCFGAGGVARTIALSLLFDFDSDTPFEANLPFKPRRLFVVDVAQAQIRSISDLLEPLHDGLEIKYICQSAAEDNNRLVAALPAGSLVINATGMGKDLPGSPLTDRATFPEESTIWELNYRGERDFLAQAKACEKEKKLHLHDGWLRFLHGWTQALQAGLQETFSPEQFQRLASLAEPFRCD